MLASLRLNARLAVATRVAVYSIAALIPALLGCGFVLAAGFFAALSDTSVSGRMLYAAALAPLPLSVAVASVMAVRDAARNRSEAVGIVPHATAAASTLAVCVLMVIAVPRSAVFLFNPPVDLATILIGFLPAVWTGAFAGTYAPEGFRRPALPAIAIAVALTIVVVAPRQAPPPVSQEQLANEALAAQPSRLPAPAVRWSRSESEADVLAVGPNGEVFHRIKDGFAVDLADGTAAWSYRSDPATGSFSDGVVGRDGTLFTIHDRRLYAIAADGAKRWDSDLPADVVFPRPVATDDEGSVYLTVQYARSSSGLMVFSTDGTLRSTTSLPELVLSGVAPSPDGAVVTAGQRVLRTARDGVVTWEHTFESSVGPPVAADGRFYVAEMRTLWVLDGAAEPILFFRAADDDTRGGAPLVGAGGVIYWMPGRLYAIGSDGRQRWSWGTPAYANSAPVLLHGEGIVFTTRDWQIVAIDLDGRKLWSYAAVPQPRVSPAKVFAGETFLYVLYPYDRLLAFGATRSGVR